MKYRNTQTSTVSGIFRNSILAMQRWVEAEWLARVEDPKLRVTFSTLTGGDAQQLLLENRIPRGAASPMPWCALMFASIGERVAPYNPWATRFVGIPVGYTPGRNEQIVERVKPVDVGIGVTFRTENLDEALAFATMWTECQPNVAIDIQNKGTGAVTRINLDLGQQTTIPGGDGPDQREIRIDTSIICRTFSGTTDMVTTAKTVEFVNRDRNVQGEDVVLSRVRAHRTGRIERITL